MLSSKEHALGPVRRLIGAHYLSEPQIKRSHWKHTNATTTGQVNGFLFI